MKSIRPWMAALGLAVVASAALPQGPDKRVIEREKKRIAVINKVKPSVVAVMGRDGKGNVVGNGSGVLIDEEGYALTNYHVTSAVRSPAMKCGLPDGKLYDAVLVGLDPVGDIALIKLIPEKAGNKFPYAKIGDSDKVSAGDYSLCMGNPFGLAYDFNPTVTFGMVSATRRFIAIPPMEYTNCIQVDTSINPGNSGGPLFNMDGELIGINSAITVSRRRANCGVGFSVSVNQIKNFLGSLRVGLTTDHASLGVAFGSDQEETGVPKIIVKGTIDSDARRRGLDVDDQLRSFNGRFASSVNQFKNLLGQYPRGWRVPLVYARENKQTEILVRLMGVTKRVIEEPGKGGPPVPPPPPITGPAKELYAAKPGFANWHFNKLGQARLLKAFEENGDFTKLVNDWRLEFGPDDEVEIKDRGAADGKSPKIIVTKGGLKFPLEPLSTSEKLESFRDPPNSGGLALAMYHYKTLLTLKEKGFSTEFYHGGLEPFYTADASAAPDGRPGEGKGYAASRVMTEVLVTKAAGAAGKWYFALEDDADKKAARWKKGQMIGFEVTADRDSDPCEVCLADYMDVGGGRKLPKKWHVRHGSDRYAEFTLKSATLK
ncbi:MAG: trypsin-like peptidase domain-containing protein [Gemmataceae bacterium]|nr:trypsin-like peptidase domain-containing protein [Gemmataceae bacterium]